MKNNSALSLQLVWFKALAFLSVAALALAACAPAASAPMADYESQSSAGAPMPPAAPRTSIGYAGEAAKPEESPDQSVERIVIKNASLTIVVDDPVKSMETISRLADELGGFVVSANAYQDQLESGVKVPRASITIRIPAEKLNDTLAQIKKESAQDPINESVNSQDVTSQYTDLKSRLRNLESTEVQLTEIMKDANKTEDVLSVYNQLVSIREQIEVIKGQIKYFEESAAMSAISVELLANEAIQPLTIGSWQPVGVAKEAVQALINTLKFIFNLVIWLIIYILPVLVVLYFVFFLPIRFVFRWLRKGKPSKKEIKAASEPPAQAQ